MDEKEKKLVEAAKKRLARKGNKIAFVHIGLGIVLLSVIAGLSLWAIHTFYQLNAQDPGDAIIMGLCAGVIKGMGIGILAMFTIALERVKLESSLCR